MKARHNARRAQPGPLEYTRRAWMRMILLATFVFLYTPIATLIAFSFVDRVTMNRERVMSDAKSSALELARSGYQPPQHRLAWLHDEIL